MKRTGDLKLIQELNRSIVAYDNNMLISRIKEIVFKKALAISFFCFFMTGDQVENKFINYYKRKELPC